MCFDEVLFKNSDYFNNEMLLLINNRKIGLNHLRHKLSNKLSPKCNFRLLSSISSHRDQSVSLLYVKTTFIAC